jgi:hypothetical protein
MTAAWCGLVTNAIDRTVAEQGIRRCTQRHPEFHIVIDHHDHDILCHCRRKMGLDLNGMEWTMRWACFAGAFPESKVTAEIFRALPIKKKEKKNKLKKRKPGPSS